MIIFLICAFLACQERIYSPQVSSSEQAPLQWQALLSRISNQDRVDYKQLKKEVDILNAYMTWLASHGPHTEKYSIRKEKKKIAFYANAYNAAVLYGVLQNWPIESVKEVDAGWFQAENVGFFLGQLFLIDGEWMSLYHLEQDLILSQFQDPRLHVLLNCASRGCPPLRYWKEGDLHTQIDIHWTSYIRNNLRQGSNGWEISELFFWYEKDFLAWSEATNLCDYLISYAQEDAKNWLKKHRKQCPLSSFPYDWALND